MCSFSCVCQPVKMPDLCCPHFPSVTKTVITPAQFRQKCCMQRKKSAIKILDMVGIKRVERVNWQQHSWERASEERDECHSLEKEKNQSKQWRKWGSTPAPPELHVSTSTSFHASRSRPSKMLVSGTKYLRGKIALTAVSGAKEKAWWEDLCCQPAVLLLNQAAAKALLGATKEKKTFSWTCDKSYKQQKCLHWRKGE